MKRYAVLAAILIAAFVGGYNFFPQSFSTALVNIKSNLAAVFFVDTVTVSSLRQKYTAIYPTEQKIKILIVPGHEPDDGGTVFGALKEREMTAELAEKLAAHLKANPHFDVIQARSSSGWQPELAQYFSAHKDDILGWKDQQKSVMHTLIDNDVIEIAPQNPHANASPLPAMRLYGINKWAADNNVDIVIHVHFNDYGSRKNNKPGEFSGVAIYVPEKQFSNSDASRKIAEYIFRELNKEYATSTAPRESAGIVEDQTLIAVGRYNTSDTARLLIEYGYIYEPQFATESSREEIFEDMASRTSRGLQDFFSEP